LASPYSHPDELVRQYRNDLVVKAAAKLYAEGIHVFCPIAHSHPINRAGSGSAESGSWKVWCDFDMHMLSSCGAMLLLTMHGWQKSVGVTAELEFAHKHNLPIFSIRPEELGLFQLSTGN
jgi:hypothetical protein